MDKHRPPTRSITTKPLVPECLFEIFDKNYGYTWEVYDKMHRRPLLEVFNDTKTSLVIRQDNNSQVDLITITHGQAYDLLMALSRALESP